MRSGGEQRHSAVAELEPAGSLLTQTRTDRRREQLPAIAPWVRYPLVVYVLSRVLYLLIAVADTFIRHWPLSHELSNWDGKWYLLTAQYGYFHTIPHVYSTLGFLPLYPALMWLGGQVLPGPGYILPGVLISLVTGAITVVLMSRLATRWWGEAASRRAILFLCLFPGSIVFSMIYSEGITMALICGCLLALEDRRWVLAGILAGLSTAIEPVAYAIIPACAVVAAIHIRRNGGWRDRSALRALWAPILSPVGAVGFAIFLWAWTGTPLASYDAQKYAWHETSTPLAIPRDAVKFVQDVVNFRNFRATPIDMNLLAGVLGAILLLWALWLMWKQRSTISLGAWVWTLGVGALALTSNSTPPNPRMLICAFPTVLIIGATRVGKSQRRLLVFTLIMTVAMSIDTFVAFGLRP